MLRTLMLLPLLLLAFPALAQSAPKARLLPYIGQWASSAKACSDPDGVGRMEISGGGKRFFWYETRCTATQINAEGKNAWRMTMSCEGEGEKFRAAPLLTLTPPNRLVFTGKNPVGQGKREPTCAAGSEPRPRRARIRPATLRVQISLHSRVVCAMPPAIFTLRW
jgi:hypothetical protein